MQGQVPARRSVVATQHIPILTKLPVQRPARILSRAHSPNHIRHSNNAIKQEDRTMNKSITSALMLLATIAFSAVALGAGADPEIGTWQLNLSKSTFPSGTAPKSQTRIYSQSPQGTTVLVKTVNADGTQSTVRSTYRFDGQDYPVSGSSDADTLMVKQVDANSATAVLKKGGKAVGTLDRMVSKDGKMLTVKTKATAANGQQTESTAVYDKQ
jgi:hypothetical protein